MAPKQSNKLILTFLLLTLILTACGPARAEPTATPTQGIDAIFTAAAQTVIAQLAATESAQPATTITPSPTGTGTATLTPIATQTRLVIPPPASGNSGAVGCNNAAFVSDVTIPDGQQLAPGATFTKTWRLQNTGTCAWNGNYKVTFVSGDGMSGVTANINKTVAVNATVDISVTLVAPATPKTYVGYWRMATDAGQPFGTSFYVQIAVGGTPVTGTPGTSVPTATATFGAVGCNNAAFVADLTTPDGTKIKAGDTFTKTWRIKNTGTCAWNANYKFTFIGGDLMGSDTTKIRRTVGVNATTDLSLDFVAPNAPGTYTGYWRMASDSGELFGTAFSVKIVVPGATFTPPPPTNTSPPPTVTGTPTPTIVPATATATGTPTPTATTASYP
jgi:hypothetical protein